MQKIFLSDPRQVTQLPDRRIFHVICGGVQDKKLGHEISQEIDLSQSDGGAEVDQPILVEIGNML